MSAKETLTEIITVSREIAVEAISISKGYEGFAMKLVNLSDLLEKVLIANSEPEEQKPVVEMSGPPEFKHAPEMEALLSGKPIGDIPTDQIWKTKELNQYWFIQVLNVNDSMVTYCRIKDSTQEIIHHKIEMTKPEFRDVEIEHQGYYLINVTEYSKKKRGQPRPDVTWNFVQKLPSTKAYTLANKWASIFAKRREAGVAY